MSQTTAVELLRLESVFCSCNRTGSSQSSDTISGTSINILSDWNRRRLLCLPRSSFYSDIKGWTAGKRWTANTGVDIISYLFMRQYLRMDAKSNLIRPIPRKAQIGTEVAGKTLDVGMLRVRVPQNLVTKPEFLDSNVELCMNKFRIHFNSDRMASVSSDPPQALVNLSCGPLQWHQQKDYLTQSWSH